MKVWTLAMVLLGWSLIWVSLGDHPLAGKSEGRYATVAAEMLDDGNWLVPHYNGQPHLTKPPLTYWAEVTSMRLLGRNELAVRLPSAVAGCLTLLGVMVMGWRLGGRAMGLAAFGLLSLMPLFTVISRLTLTDAMLTLFWSGTLAGGYLAVTGEQRRWPAVLLLWTSVALGLMTKGQLAWVPVALLVIWLAVGGRWRQVGRLHLLAGTLLSAVPLVAWLAMVIQRQPDAWSTWYEQIVSRAVGAGDHNEPIWYFVPVFLGGLFPATAMLDVPGLNRPLRASWQVLREGGAASLCVVALVVPFVLFTLNSGKLATYLMPLCPPMALLGAMTLVRWLKGEADHPPAGHHPPDVRITFFVCVLVFVGLVTAWVIRPVVGQPMWVLPPAVVIAVAAGWQCLQWKRRPRGRALTLSILYVTCVICGWSAAQCEDALRRDSTERSLYAQIRTLTGLDRPHLVAFGYEPKGLGFYGGVVTQTYKVDDLKRDLANDRDQLVIVANVPNWQVLQRDQPDVAALFDVLLKWDPGPMVTERWIVCPRDRPRPSR